MRGWCTHSIPLTLLRRKGMMQFSRYMEMRWLLRLACIALRPLLH